MTTPIMKTWKGRKGSVKASKIRLKKLKLSLNRGKLASDKKKAKGRRARRKGVTKRKNRRWLLAKRKRRLERRRRKHSYDRTLQEPRHHEVIIHLLNQTFLKDGQEFVAELYRQLLIREPDEAYLHFADRLTSGATKIEILLTILQSDEAMQLYLRPVLPPAEPRSTTAIAGRLQSLLAMDDEGFIQSLYRELLDREPEAAGRRYFMDLLAQGQSRFSLFLHVLNSEECLGVPSVPPDGFYSSTREWATSHHHHQDRELIVYKEFPGDTLPHFAEAKSLEQPVRMQFCASSFPPPPAFIATVPRGRVWGMFGAVITGDNKLLIDVSPNGNSIDAHSLSQQWESLPHDYAPYTVGVLTYGASQNYFHWLFDVLPRIHLLNQSGLPIDKLLINRNGNFPFQDQLLNLMDFPKEKIIDTNSKFHLRCRMLVVSSLMMSLGYPKWTCDFLRNQLLLNRNVPLDNEYERIYISRSNAAGRRIVNEEEIVDTLNRYRFKSVVLESLPVERQIQLFASAKAVVAPHGAGLANLAFCSPGTKVIELFSPNHIPTYYWIISNHVQLDYYYLVGETQDVTGNPAADYCMSADQLSKILHLAGL